MAIRSKSRSPDPHRGTATDDPLAARVQRYLVLHREARRRSEDWRRAMDALERHGLARYPSYRCEGKSFPVLDGDLSELAGYFDRAIAAASDAASKATIATERTHHLEAAAQAYRAWHTVADELGVEAASARNDEAWARVDALKLESLWASVPRTLAGAVALLQLVHDSGWLGGSHPDETAGPRRALRRVIAFLEALPTPASPSPETATPRPRRRAP